MRVYPIGAITKGQQGEELAEIGDLQEAGCVAVSDDGKPVASAALMRRALEYARGFGLPMIDHGEDPTLARAACMHEGAVSTRLGLRGMPAAGEASWSRATSCSPSSPAAASTSRTSRAAASVDAVRRGEGARRAGDLRGRRRTTCSSPTTPSRGGLRHQHQDEPAAARRRPIAQALLEGLARRHDRLHRHRPRAAHRDEKDVEFDQARRSASSGSRPRCRSASTAWCGAGVVTLPRLVELLSTRPARVLGLPGGTLAPGSPADLTLLDLARRRAVDPGRFESRSREHAVRRLDAARLAGDDDRRRAGRLAGRAEVGRSG